MDRDLCLLVTGRQDLGTVLGVVPIGRWVGDGREGVEVVVPGVIDVDTPESLFRLDPC